MVVSGDSECLRWRSMADCLVGDETAPIALLGAPLGERSLTPGRCDLAPATVRDTLRRMSVYDLETATEYGGTRIFDAGDLPLKGMSPAECFAPILSTVVALSEGRALVILLGGNNAITRPGLHGVARGNLQRTGLLTLDAHFDLRDTDCGLNNGNPVRALLEDGLPGANIAQIGLAPFANTARMHRIAVDAGIMVRTLSETKTRGLVSVVEEALHALSRHCDRIYVDFDIDVIDRCAAPGAPGARPGGLAVGDFFDATRRICAHPKVAAVDLTEFDPSLDVSAITALTAARWVCEVVAGYHLRR